MSEALTDVTGGIVERFELGRKAPADLQDIVLKAFKKSSLMGCSIDVITILLYLRLIEVFCHCWCDILVFQCLTGQAPAYLADDCQLTSVRTDSDRPTQ